MGLCQLSKPSSIKSLKDDSNYKSVLNLLYAHQVMIQHIDDGYCLEILHKRNIFVLCKKIHTIHRRVF